MQARQRSGYRSSYRLNESPSKKEGKCTLYAWNVAASELCLNESPSKKEGKLPDITTHAQPVNASMKALPKRKGNSAACPGVLGGS